MKKFCSICALFCALFVFVNCGGSSNGFKAPENLDGQLGEYYKIKSTEIRPEEAQPGDDMVTYAIIVELEKNEKPFDFYVEGMSCKSSADELDDLGIGEWSITGTVFGPDGEKIDRIHPKKRDVKTLLSDCAQPEQTKKIMMKTSLNKKECDMEKTIVIRGLMKAFPVGSVKDVKVAAEEAREAMKEASEIANTMNETAKEYVSE